MWTTLRVDHMHPLRRRLAHRGYAFGLTRFACLNPDESLPFEQPTAGARTPKGGQGAQPWGYGGGRPPPWSALGAGGTPWGESEPQGGYTLCTPPR